MAGFSELIRNFDKIRDYMRDFYIYGFKQRGDFQGKSSRTYDNEKRRIESYLSNYINWEYDKSGKRTFISLDSSAISVNPLYAAWKSKSFTAKDIMLHFYILDALRKKEQKAEIWMSVDELTDEISLRGGVVFEAQTVRLKCAEYVKAGLLKSEKRGRALYYSIWDMSDFHISDIHIQASSNTLNLSLLDAVKFFQEAAPFGEIGSFYLDARRAENDLFRFKHHYIVHTLEDGVLLQLLKAMREERTIQFVNHSHRSGQDSTVIGVPVKIFASTVTGRRYVCCYYARRRRFVSYRLDYIKSVKLLEPYPEYQQVKEIVERDIEMVWGVSFGINTKKEILCMKLYIDEENERYVLERLLREGRGGEVVRLKKNVFLYTKELFDTNEMSTWIKTFTGRIIALEGTNGAIINRFYEDMKRMKEMYLKEGEEVRS